MYVSKTHRTPFRVALAHPDTGPGDKLMVGSDMVTVADCLEELGLCLDSSTIEPIPLSLCVTGLCGPPHELSLDGLTCKSEFVRDKDGRIHTVAADSGDRGECWELV